MLRPLEFQHLKNVEFPVYTLENEEVTLVDGLLLFEDNLVIDDRTRSGKTLGIRRLQTPHTLYPLKKAYLDLESLVMGKHKYFVDNKGRGFQYIRTKFEKIKYHKIKKIIYKDNLCLLKCEKIDTLIPMKKPPSPELKWAGILYLGNYPWSVVQFSETKKRTSKKKI